MCVCVCVTLGIFLNQIPSALFMYILIEFPALLHTGKQTTRVLGIVHEQDGRKRFVVREMLEKSLFGAYVERN